MAFWPIWNATPPLCALRPTRWAAPLLRCLTALPAATYTKAADIICRYSGEDPPRYAEDDSAVPNVIADFIGDNVNDIAGNCSDLLESFVATMAASVMIAVTIYNGAPSIGEGTLNATVIFPVILAGVGLLGCLLGLGYASIRKMSDNPSKELNLATWISAGCTIVLGFVAGEGRIRRHCAVR